MKKKNKIKLALSVYNSFNAEMHVDGATWFITLKMGEYDRVCGVGDTMELSLLDFLENFQNQKTEEYQAIQRKKESKQARPIYPIEKMGVDVYSAEMQESKNQVCYKDSDIICDCSGQCKESC